MTTIRVIFLSGGLEWLFVKLVTFTFGLVALSRLLPGRNRQVPGYRPMTGATLGICMAVATVSTIGGLAVMHDHAAQGAAVRHSSVLAAARPVHASLPMTGTPYLGVFEDGEEGSWAPVSKFANAVGRQPNIVLMYQAWKAAFPATFADTASSHGAVLLIQLLPTNISMAAIAHGNYDGYLQSYAAGVRAYGGQVIISFAPEMNGDWYSWGWHHSTPANYVAAWRHLVTVFRREGASNVKWLWVVNRVRPVDGPIQDFWPGAGYVTWVGYDDYIYDRAETFQSVDAPTVAAIRAVTSKPVMLSETSVGQVAGPASIPGLVAGVARNHLLGMIWFDERQNGGHFHQDWHLEDSPRAVTAMRRAVKAYMPG
jgi:hypothetical protein